MNDTEKLIFEVNGIQYSVSGYELIIWRGATCLAKLNLIPSGVAEPVRISRFRRDKDSIWASLEGGIDGRVILEIQDGLLCYRVETEMSHFDKLTYFPDSILCGDLWHTFVWTQRDRAWEMNEDVSVKVGECGDGRIENEGWILDPGDSPPYWPGRGCPRVMAAHNQQVGWWGICIPGPIPVCETNFTMNRCRFEISFDYLSPGCEDGFMPTAVFALPLPEPSEPYSIMRVMWNLSKPWRLEPGRDYEPSQFVGMSLCHPWEAMQHACGNAFTDDVPPADEKSPMNSQFLLDLLHNLMKIEPSLKWHFPLPQGWFKNMGDFIIGENFGGEQGLRELADKFRLGGHLLTVHERFHHFNNHSEIGQKHPEWATRLRPGRKKPDYWSANPEDEGPVEIMDITREEVRDHLKNIIHRFVSDEPGCINMDGIAMTGNHWPNSLDYELYDENYGVGDLLAYKINKELFLYGKSIKPCGWFIGAANRIYGMGRHISTMEDHLPIPIHSINQLRLITNLFPEYPLHMASYCMTRTKSLSFWPLSVALGAPEVDCLDVFSNPTFIKRDWIEIEPRYKRRLHSVLACYANSPYTADTVNIPVKVKQNGLMLEADVGRKRTQGPLAGFYSAISVGSNTVVTYSPTKAAISSTKGKTIKFPLPPGKKPKVVTSIKHDGTAEPHEYSVSNGDEQVEIALHVEDCGGTTKLVEVEY